MLLKPSLVADLCRTMAREGSPVFANARLRPVAMPRTDTRTPTTPAIPITTTSEGTRRPRRLRRFMAVTAAICFHMRKVRAPQRAASAVATSSLHARHNGGVALTIARHTAIANPAPIAAAGIGIGARPTRCV